MTIIKDADDFVRQLLIDTMEADREFKVALCANGPDDLPTRILYMNEGERKMNMIMPMQLGGPALVPAELIGATCGLLAKQLGTPFFVAFADEVLGKYFPEPQDAPTERGVLTEQFKQGDPEVFEALSIMSVHRRDDRTLRVLSVQQPFHYGDGTVNFGDEEWIDSLETDTFQKGAVINALIAVFGSEQN